MTPELYIFFAVLVTMILGAMLITILYSIRKKYKFPRILLNATILIWAFQVLISSVLFLMYYFNELRIFGMDFFGTLLIFSMGYGQLTMWSFCATCAAYLFLFLRKKCRTMIIR